MKRGEIPQLRQRIAQLDRNGVRTALQDALREWGRAPPDPFPDREAVELGLAVCRDLYARSLSAEALPLAKAVLTHAESTADRPLARRAATACGLLSADSMDLVGAIEHHVTALRISMEGNDREDASRTWNNLGLAMGISGHYELANRCYRRGLDLLREEGRPNCNRYVIASNLSSGLYHVDEVGEGLRFAEQALQEESAALREECPLAAVHLRRNLVRLLVALGRTEEARSHAEACAALAEQVQMPRAHLASAEASATLELARGDTDIALSRLAAAVALAREVPVALRETLTILVRAEERAGHPERALLRLRELSDHIYQHAIDCARGHVELAGIAAETTNRLRQNEGQARARLVACVEQRTPPEAWPVLDRLAIAAVMRRDPTGSHGKRVGALVKALAEARGEEPLEALELGLATELHDIGMMSVPEAILGKRGRLNDAERTIVRRHVEAGAAILSDDSHPRIFLARQVAAYHHARWDGRGYPEGVSGERIPAGARACAIAEAYDAMMCGLGERPARSMEQALGELQQHAGTQFDPHLTREFDDMIRSEMKDLGIGMGGRQGAHVFHALLTSLREDRGFV